MNIFSKESIHDLHISVKVDCSPHQIMKAEFFRLHSSFYRHINLLQPDYAKLHLYIIYAYSERGLKPLIKKKKIKYKLFFYESNETVVTRISLLFSERL